MMVSDSIVNEVLRWDDKVGLRAGLRENAIWFPYGWETKS